MEIKINNKYHLTSDTKQFILHEKKGNNEELTFFTSLNGLVKSLIQKKVRTNDNIRTLKQLGDSIIVISEQIENSFKEYVKHNKD